MIVDQVRSAYKLIEVLSRVWCSARPRPGHFFLSIHSKTLTTGECIFGFCLPYISFFLENNSKFVYQSINKRIYFHFGVKGTRKDEKIKCLPRRDNGVAWALSAPPSPASRSRRAHFSQFQIIKFAALCPALIQRYNGIVLYMDDYGDGRPLNPIT